MNLRFANQSMPLAALSLLLLTGFACDRKEAETAKGEAAPAKLAALPDRPLDAYREQLLDSAFQIASLIPSDPHIKDRCKAQEAVALAALELGQPTRALRHAEQIDDWRRAYCLAELAIHSAKNGDAQGARAFLAECRKPPYDKAEDWQRDRIKAAAAQAYAILGDDAQAGAANQGLSDAEAGRLAKARASVASEASFDELVKSAETMSDPKNVDQRRNSAAILSELFNRFYGTPARRDLALEKFRASSEGLPVIWRLDLLAGLAEIAMNHKDNAKALELIGEAQAILDGHEWPPEAKLPLAARQAELRFRAGDEAKAREDAAAALTFYKDERDRIFDIWRARALRPLAKAFAAMNDKASAMAVFKTAVDEGAVNPNSRPRAKDLAATCTAMALCGLEPDAALSSRIEQIRSKLGAPW